MNMYVTNLSFHTGEDELRKLFEEFGAVSSAKVIADRETGRSRGFGFVEMGADEEANAAIKALHNKDVEGRALSVTIAREKAPRSDNKRW